MSEVAVAGEYETELVYFGEVNKRAREGWEPVPGAASVIRLVGTFAQTWVWMRRKVST